MATKTGVLLHLEFIVVAIAIVAGRSSPDAAAAHAAPSKPYTMPFNRTSFPNGFVFGAGSSAYQTEGAADIDGRGPSIWDTFAKDHPEKIEDHSNGDVADDFYHRYKEDVKLMKKIGLDSFRFSISWSRILPKGKISCGVNELGVKFYNDLINELLANGIVPFVTLFHWDLPQALEDEYGGFLSRKIVDDFKEYAEFCFETFGDRVKHWTTFNEPYIFVDNGYNGGGFAPGRCSSYAGNCTQGNSATEPYIAGHHMLLAHAKAVHQYKRKYQASQKGQIGIVLNTHWILPKSVSSETDRKAADRTLDFMFGWFLHPITYGHYPESMRHIVGNRLPIFTQEESKMLKGSLDFLGVNYYTARYASNNPTSTNANPSLSTDMQSTLSAYKAGIAIGPQTPVGWIYMYPRGLYNVMLYVRDKYKNHPIYITENGVAEVDDPSLPIQEVLKDGLRIKYHTSHLTYLLQAIEEGANVKGYYTWSFWDNFEWQSGYTARFGMIYVDYKNKLERHLKYSAYWFKMFLLH